jgi:hypothetical protein
VKDWAVMVGELRLWLSLIIETEEKYIDIYGKPLLPSFTFKMRRGDSLVEEIGGRPLSLRGEFRHISPFLRNKIEEIKGKKAKYFSGARHEWEQEIEALEHDLLRDVLLEEIKKIEEKIKTIKKVIESAPKEQIDLIKVKEKEAPYGGKKKELEAEIERLDEEKERLQGASKNIGKEKDYFFWEIDFAEVFAEKGGFDIVIGNPPYVRQEQIAFPLEREEDFDADEWRDRKRQYKEKLINSSRILWGDELKVDRKSDLYVYFYYQGIGLLSPAGTFCFINSNSWLDVGYGAGLQEFLLKRMEPLYVIDNIARRSFEADVNTVIVLIKRPVDIKSPQPPFAKGGQEGVIGKGGQEGVIAKGGQGGILKFIAFKKPFDEVIKPETILEIENARERTVTENFRITPKDSRDLLIEGMEIPEEGEEEWAIHELPLPKDLMQMPYSGNKWGGKYLRAPDIYWTILEKGKGKLVRLGDIAEVRFGIKTGADRFFYLLEKEAIKLGIEEEFRTPILVSSDQIDGYITKKESTDIVLVTSTKSPIELRGTGFLKYIKMGESKPFLGRGGASIPAKRPSCSGHNPYWYSIAIPPVPPIYWMEMRRERYFTILNKVGLSADHTFYAIYPKSKIDSFSLCGLLNSTLVSLFVEVFANDPGGGGTSLQTPIREIKKYVLLANSLIGNEEIKKSFRLMTSRQSFSILKEVSFSDRRELDNIIFGVLGLTQGERDAVYEAVIELVTQRLVKAKSKKL